MKLGNKMDFGQEALQGLAAGGLPDIGLDTADVPEFAPADLAPAAPVASAPSKAKRGKSDLMPPPALKAIYDRVAAEVGVPVNVLVAMGHTESGHRPDIDGPQTKYGAAGGIMQYLPDMAAAHKINRYNAEESISQAAKDLRARLAKNGGDMANAVARHHAGDNPDQLGPKSRAYAEKILAKASRLAPAYEAEQAAQLKGASKAREAAREQAAEAKRGEYYPQGGAKPAGGAMPSLAGNGLFGFSEQLQQARQAAPYGDLGVMNGFNAENTPAAKARSTTPVTPEAEAQVRAALTTLPDSQRQALLQDKGWRGQVARTMWAESENAKKLQRSTGIVPKHGDVSPIVTRDEIEASYRKSGYTPDQAAQLAMHDLAGHTDQVRASNFDFEGMQAARDSLLVQAGRDVKRGASNLRAMTEGLAGTIYGLAGEDELARSALETAVARMEKTARENPALIGSYENIHGGDDALRYAVEAVAENLPMFLPSLASGGVGGLFARRAASGLMSDLVAKVGRDKALQTIERHIMLGQTAGAAASSIGMETGSIAGDIYQKTGEASPWLALGAGIPAGLLDAVEPIMALRRIAGPVADGVGASIIKRLGVEAGKQFMAEAGTEGLQTIIENAAGLAAQHKQPLTPELLDGVVDAMLKGGIGGGVMGAGSEALGALRGRKPAAPGAAQYAGAVDAAFKGKPSGPIARAVDKSAPVVAANAQAAAAMDLDRPPADEDMFDGETTANTANTANSLPTGTPQWQSRPGATMGGAPVEVGRKENFASDYPLPPAPDAAAIADSDARVAAGNEQRAAAGRRQILDAVLADDSVKNPAASFMAELQRAGVRDTSISSQEAAAIQRFIAAREAFTGQALDEEPSAPNELGQDNAADWRAQRDAEILGDEGSGLAKPALTAEQAAIADKAKAAGQFIKLLRKNGIPVDDERAMISAYKEYKANANDDGATGSQVAETQPAGQQGGTAGTAERPARHTAGVDASAGQRGQQATATANPAGQPAAGVGRTPQNAYHKRLRLIDIERHSVRDAIAKLGGIRKDEAMREWGATLVEGAKSRFVGAPLFRRNNGGMPLDKMREALAELGYLPADSDINDLYDAFDEDRLHHSGQERQAAEHVAKLGRQQEQRAPTSVSERTLDNHPPYNPAYDFDAEFNPPVLLPEDLNEAIADNATGMNEEEAKAHADLVALLHAEFGEEAATDILERAAIMAEGGSDSDYVKSLEGLIHEQQQQTAASTRQSEKPAAGKPAESRQGTAQDRSASPALTLESYDQAELDRREQAQRDAEAKRKAEEQAAERKRQADAEVGEFVLTGSNTDADQLAARGQGGLFDAPPAKLEAAKPTVKESLTADATETKAPYPGKTELQQRKAFGKALGYTGYDGLDGRRNQQLGTAVYQGDASKALALLGDSKSPVIRQVAELAKRISGLKVAVDEAAVEEDEAHAQFNRDTYTSLMSKAAVAVLDKLRHAANTLDAKDWHGNDQALREQVPEYRDFLDALDHDGTILPVEKRRQSSDAWRFQLGTAAGALTGNSKTYLSVKDALADMEEWVGDNERTLRRNAEAHVAKRTAIAGAYNDQTKTVTAVSAHNASSEHVIAHELVHAITADALANPTEAQHATVKKLQVLFNHVRKALPESRQYGLKTLSEFVAEGLSNPQFQYELATIPYKRTTAWGKFTQFIAELVGIQHDTAFHELLALTEELAMPGAADQENQQQDKAGADKQGPSDSQAVNDYLAGRRDTPPTVEEVAAESAENAKQGDAPSTRRNGEVEHAAADRLEQLHEQMAGITNRNSLEGNAKAAIRSVIDELRKPKTVSNVVAVLEKASSDLMRRKYGAFADVVQEVADSLNSATPPDDKLKGREMGEGGRPKDGKPILPGDVFRTLSGRETTPYPKQKGEKYASQWLIDNAVAEAESRGDKFNARQFAAVTLLKGGQLTPADIDSMQMYLFEQQPPVVKSSLKPLVAPEAIQEPIDNATPPDGNRKERKSDDVLSDENLALASRHKKIDKTLDLMDDEQIRALYFRAKLPGSKVAIETQRERLKQAHPDDIEPLLQPGSGEGSKPTSQAADYGANNKLVTKDRAEELRAKLKAKLKGTQLNSGIDPELLAIGTELAVYHIEAGARKFADFVRAIADHLDMQPSELRPYLRSWYNGARDMTEDMGGDVAGMDSAEEVRAELAKLDAGEQAPAAAANAGALADHFYEHLQAGTMPKDNNGLRKLVTDFDGKPADNARLKQAQEDLEAAIARYARDVVAQGKGDKGTFDALLELYNGQPNLNIRTSTSVENQAYSTPAPLAFVAARLAGIGTNTKVYEPTAGNGMLLLTADPKNATANELEDQRFANLQAQGFDAMQGDALQVVESGALSEKSQDAVITNPPFGSVKDDNGKATKVSVDGYKIGKIDHLIAAEALKAMKDNGRATLILGADKVAGGLSTDDRIFFNWLYSHYNVVGHFEVDGKLYSRQGASWPVRVITINGRQQSNSVSPTVGTIGRVNSWEGVYEQFENVLGTSDRATRQDGAVGRSDEQPAANDQGAAPRADAQQADKSVQSDGRTGSGKPAGNVTGTHAGTDRNQSGSQSGTLAGSRTEQRPDASESESDRLAAGAGQQPDPAKANQTSTGRADAGQPAGNALADAENAFQAKYVPRSERKDDGVLVPINMAQPLQDALSTLEDAVGNIDEYAADELGYNSVAELHDALMGLQVDSVASAIYQIKERNKGIIIADQTGIGKGRQAASIIRWAKRAGHIPVFVTVKPQLFTDMFNDLADIGSNDIAPFIMNSDAWIASASGDKLFANRASQHKKTLADIAATGQLPEGRNALFMTYSQINTSNIQRSVVAHLADRAVFILDESHNAGGESSTGEFVRGVLEPAAGVVYLSATYAKRPDNMPLYFKTDIGNAISDSGNLMSAMDQGGLPLQTVVSNNLVKSGQMFRRERSYDGVSIETKVDTANRQEHERLSDHVTLALRAIVEADGQFHDGFVKKMKDELAESGMGLNDIAGNQAQESVNHTEFSSVVHNFIRQMLLGLKADTAAQEAIDAIRRGEKPLIALENTMGSFLAEYADSNGIKQGDSLGKFDYRTVLSRALERSRYIMVVTPEGDEVRQKIELDQLDPETRIAYDRAQDIIDRLDITIPVSPLDWIRHRIQEAGYSVAEITGRSIAVDYSQGTPTLTQVPTAEQNDKVNTTRMFNSGALDAIILNVSGSTGISLHASEKFTDQRPRRMIVAQPAQDINIFMQMLGRIHRTGQVRLPAYTILNADLPTEKRPTALLNKKMKSLNANTSSNTESATSIKSADMLNKYGDLVISNYLSDNQDLAETIGLSGTDSADGQPAQDLARKVTGRVALLPIQQQKDFYAEVEEQYNALIEYLNDTNQNDLEPRTFDFDAELQKEMTLVEATSPDSPFGAEAVYGEYKIKAQGKPMTAEEVQAETQKNLAGQSSGAAHANALIDSLDKKWAADLAASGKEKESEGNEGKAFMREHTIGTAWRVEINGDFYNGVVTNLRNTHKKNGNPFSLSKIQVTLAVNGPLRSITVPASQWKKIEVAPIYLSVANAFREQVAGAEQAKIITGNLLAAYAELKDSSGTIISFTKKDGSIEQGILLPKKFTLAQNTRGDFQFRSPQDVVKFLTTSRDPNVARYGVSSRDGTVRVLPGARLEIVVPKSKAKGGKYFLDKKLTALTGDFVSSGSQMIVHVDNAKVTDALGIIMAKSPLYALPSMTEDARRILGLPPAAKLESVAGSTQSQSSATPSDPAKPGAEDAPAKQADTAPAPDAQNIDLKEVKHITGKGKELTGYVVDLPLNVVKERIDKFTFRKDGGLFVRKEHAEKLQQVLQELAALPSGASFSIVGNSNAARRGSPAATPVTVQDARSIVNRLIAGLDVRSRDRVHVVPAVADLPQEIQDWLESSVKEEDHDIPGVYWAGQTYVVAGNNYSEAQVEETLLHELVGHYGMRVMFGADTAETMQDLFDAMGGWKGYIATAEKAGLMPRLMPYYEDNKGSPRLVFTMMDELIAHLAGMPQWPRRALREFIGRVKNFLREHGFTGLSKYTLSDLAYLLSKAQAAVQAGDSRIDPVKNNAGKASMSVASAGALLQPQDLADIFNDSPLAPWIGQLYKAGKLLLRKDFPLPASFGKAAIQGFAAEGKISLIANNIPSRDAAMAVLLHEVFHNHGEALLGTPAWNKLLGELGALLAHARQFPDGKAGRLWSQAEARVSGAAAGGFAMTDAKAAEELGAYAIEHAELAPATWQRWVSRLLGHVKAWVRRTFGVQLGRLTPEQLRALAIAALKNGSVVPSNNQNGNKSQSVGRVPDKIEVDGVMRPTLNSNGQRIAQTEDGIRNFWRWFGDSNVVDSKGRPLVVYHGTKADIRAFDPARTGTASDAGYFGVGVYFAERTDQAEVYGSAVYPVYIAAKNVFTWEMALKDRLKFGVSVWGIKGAIDIMLGRSSGANSSYQNNLFGMLASGRKLPAGLHDAIMQRAGVTEAELAPYRTGGELAFRENKAAFNEMNLRLSNALRDELIARGYDGIFVNNMKDKGVGDYKEWVAFHPEQIKSAIGNNGDFDPTDPRISYSVRSPDDEAISFKKGNFPGAEQTDKVALGKDVQRKLEKLHPGWADRLREAGLSGLRTALAVLPGNAVVDIYADRLPALRDSQRFGERLDGMRQMMQKEADHVFRSWQKLPQEAADKMADLMHEATIWQLHPDQAAPEKLNKKWLAKHAQLAADWDALPAEAQQVYRDVRDLYAKRTEQMFDALAARIDRIQGLPSGSRSKMLAELRQSFDKTMGKGPYFPLSRFGDFLVIAKRLDDDGKTLEKIVLSAETEFEQKQMAADLARRGFDVVETDQAKKNFRAGSMGADMSDFAVKIIDKLDGVDMDDEQRSELLDDINQMLIDALPPASARKHFKHRKGVPGFSNDAVRAFVRSQSSMASHIANITYQDRIDGAIAEAYKQARADQQNVNELAKVVQEMEERAAIARQFTAAAWANALTSLGFANFLGFSLSQGLLNLTQVPVLTYPALAAKFGEANADKALASAYAKVGRALVAKGGETVGDVRALQNLDQDSKDVLAEMEARGKLDLTMSLDLARAGGGPQAPGRNGVTKSAQWVGRYMGWFNHVSEAANRQITAMAAYQLALQNGMTKEQAFDYTAKLLDDSQFNYAFSNRPRMLMSNGGRVLGMMHTFGINMMYRLGRNLYHAVGDWKGQEGKQARAVVMRMLAVHIALAGVSSLPLLPMSAAVAGTLAHKLSGSRVVGAIGAAGGAALMQALIGGMLADDDEPWDWEAERRALLNDIAGSKTVAEILDKGLLRMLGVDVANRISMNDLLYRDFGAGYTTTPAQTWLDNGFTQLVGGAAYGAIKQYGRAIDYASNGQYHRAAEAALPKFAADLLKASRYAREDVRVPVGATSAHRADVSAFDVVRQAMGFTPAKVAEVNAAERAKRNAAAETGGRRRDLLDSWVNAKLEGDLEGMAAAMKAIAKYNATQRENGYSELAILPKERLQKLRSLRKSVKNKEAGKTVSKRYRDVAEDAAEEFNAE